MLLEVLMSCTKHVDLSNSLTASCVARLMICWVGRLHFSGLVCSVLSLDECLIEINYSRFCVVLRKLCRLVWHRVQLICNVKRCFYWTMIFLRKMAEFSLWWFSCSHFIVNIVVRYSWRGSFDARRLSSCMCAAKWVLCQFLAVEENCLAVSRVILRTLDEWKCFRYLEKVILWSRLCLAKDEFKYHRKHVYFIQKMCFLPQRKWPAIKDPLRGKKLVFFSTLLFYILFYFE